MTTAPLGSTDRNRFMGRQSRGPCSLEVSFVLTTCGQSGTGTVVDSTGWEPVSLASPEQQVPLSFHPVVVKMTRHHHLEPVPR